MIDGFLAWLRERLAPLSPRQKSKPLPLETVWARAQEAERGLPLERAPLRVADRYYSLF